MLSDGVIRFRHAHSLPLRRCHPKRFGLDG